MTLSIVRNRGQIFALEEEIGSQHNLGYGGANKFFGNNPGFVVRK
jgi:hypothetical protein